MGIVESLIDPLYELSEFRKHKLQHEFRCFYDVNKDGKLQWKDFDMARDDICKLSGWKPGSQKYKQSHELFIDIWRNLQDNADENIDGSVTEDEWLQMWTNLEKQANNETKKKKEKKKERKEERNVIVLDLSDPTEESPKETKAKETPAEEVTEEIEEEIVPNNGVPEWLEKYILYKFNLYDRTGDGEIDVDEFEYVLSSFNVAAKDCKVAYRIFSMNGEKRVNFEYFRELAIQYYRSDDPGDLGNFINGRLSFDDDD